MFPPKRFLLLYTTVVYAFCEFTLIFPPSNHALVFKQTQRQNKNRIFCCCYYYHFMIINNYLVDQNYKPVSLNSHSSK